MKMTASKRSSKGAERYLSRGMAEKNRVSRMRPNFTKIAFCYFFFDFFLNLAHYLNIGCLDVTDCVGQQPRPSSMCPAI